MKFIVSDRISKLYKNCLHSLWIVNITNLLVLFDLKVTLCSHHYNCLDVSCTDPLPLDFTKNAEDTLTESHYAALIGNITGKTQCAHFRRESNPNTYLPTNQLASCPWIFVKNVDNDRVPRELWEAQCVCRCGLRDADCLMYRCAPVYTYVTVLRRHTCTIVRKEVFPLRVGCTQIRVIRRTRVNEMLE